MDGPTSLGDPILRAPAVNKDIHCMFVEEKPRTVFFHSDTLFTAFVATVQKIITYTLGEHNPG